MVRHVVLFKLKTPTPEVITRTIATLSSLRGKIPGLLEVEVGQDFLHSQRSFDVALLTVFDSRASLEAYQTHPAHVPVREYMHEVRSDSVSLDYDM